MRKLMIVLICMLLVIPAYAKIGISKNDLDCSWIAGNDYSAHFYSFQDMQFHYLGIWKNFIGTYETKPIFSLAPLKHLATRYDQYFKVNIITWDGNDICAN